MKPVNSFLVGDRIPPFFSEIYMWNELPSKIAIVR